METRVYSKIFLIQASNNTVRNLANCDCPCSLCERLYPTTVRMYTGDLRLLHLMLFSNFNFCIILFYFILFKGEKKKKNLIYVGRRLLSVFHTMEKILCVYTEVIVTETKS